MEKINSQILTIFLLIFGGFLYSCSDKGTEPQDISLKQAEEIVLSKLLSGDNSGKIVYELQNKIKAGTAIYSVDSMYTAPTDSWFFFIDDLPGYYWVHPCRYVFICCSSGKDTVYEGHLFPPRNLDSLTVVKY